MTEEYVVTIIDKEEKYIVNDPASGHWFLSDTLDHNVMKDHDLERLKERAMNCGLARSYNNGNHSTIKIKKVLLEEVFAVPIVNVSTTLLEEIVSSKNAKSIAQALESQARIDYPGYHDYYWKVEDLSGNQSRIFIYGMKPEVTNGMQDMRS